MNHRISQENIKMLLSNVTRLLWCCFYKTVLTRDQAPGPPYREYIGIHLCLMPQY